MALMPVRYSHAATIATRIASCQASTRHRSDFTRALAPLGTPSCIRSPRLRLRLANQLPPLIPRELLTQLVPDLAVLARVLVRLAQADHVARPRQLHVVHALDASRPAGHHHDAVRQRDGLGKIVGDED